MRLSRSHLYTSISSFLQNPRQPRGDWHKFCALTEDKPTRFGLYDHTLLAVTPERLSLGTVGGHSYAREPDTLGQANERSTLPIEAQESLRWLTGYRVACELARKCPTTRIVSVGDREADIYDIFVEARQQQEQAAQLGPRAEFLVRSRVPRSLTQRDEVAGGATYLNRATPDIPCTAAFAASEWKSVWRVVTKKKLTKKPPTLAEFLKLVTQLGGYNNRATEAPPGPQAF